MSAPPHMYRLNDLNEPYVSRGPLLTYMAERGRDSIAGYRSAGGYKLAQTILRSHDDDVWLSELDRAGVRGRGGGGFPTAHKWWLLNRQAGRQRIFICNANFGHAGSFKEAFLLRENPHFLIESVLIATALTGGRYGFICVPHAAAAELSALRRALEEAYREGVVGLDALGSTTAIELFVYELADIGVAGEETAILNAMEGKRSQPREKASLPTTRGVGDGVAAVNNLETVLQAAYALSVGAESYRSCGTGLAPGTMVFSLSGNVVRPGLYELPLGSELHELIFNQGLGPPGGAEVKGIFPGGSYSPVLGPEHLRTKLDYQAMRAAGSDLGNGNVIVFDTSIEATVVAKWIAEQNMRVSCGKCLPCEDGTARTLNLLSNLNSLHEPGIDRTSHGLPPTQRNSFKILNNSMAGISYTDTVAGLDKIIHLCEWYKHRGDCHHSYASANVIQSLVTRYVSEFDPNRSAKEAECNGTEAQQAV